MLQGKQSWVFPQKPSILATAAVVGPDEGKGPLNKDFDLIHEDLTRGEKSWEKAEVRFIEDAVDTAISKSGFTKGDMHFYIGGDLMNQIISNTFAARTFAIPYLGIFGACSTSMEGLALAAQLVDSGAANKVVTGTCSHNSTAEKQFRYPTEYGAQKPPTAQYTVTGAGAAVLGKDSRGLHPVVTGATIGKVVDMGITDPNNMGAAMAPAAVDTIQAHLQDFNREPGYYDLIVTGDLASVGYDIANELFKKHKIPIDQTTYKDCGMMIYDLEKQGVQAGGSGCACSATVTYGHLMKQMAAGNLNRILVVATGALMSPLSFQQGETIPCIAHAVAIERGANQR